jgi:hypothetical protein
MERRTVLLPDTPQPGLLPEKEARRVAILALLNLPVCSESTRLTLLYTRDRLPQCCHCSDMKNRRSCLPYPSRVLSISSLDLISTSSPGLRPRIPSTGGTDLSATAADGRGGSSLNRLKTFRHMRGNTPFDMSHLTV